jgi:hypothetical protein
MLVAVCAALGASGCTLVGLGIGATVDSKSKTLQPGPVWQVTTLAPGTSVALDLADGRRLQGEIGGTRFREPEVYAPVYDAARLALAGSVDLPELGPGVLSGVAAGPEQQVVWMGVDLTGIVVRNGGSQTTVAFERVAALRDAHGRVVSGPMLQRLVQARQLPLLSEIVLRGVKEPVPVDRVAQIEAPSSKKTHGKLIGVLVGLAVDAILAAGYIDQRLDDESSVHPAVSHPRLHLVSLGAQLRREPGGTR